MESCQIEACRSVTFLEEPDLRLIWFDDEGPFNTCRVEVTWREFPIYMHSYPRQSSFDTTVERYSKRVRQIALLISKRMKNNE